MSCKNCDGQPFVIDREVAEAIASLAGPRRRDNRRINQYGGKGIIQFNPPTNQNQIQQSVCLVDWQSEDGMPHPLTVEWGRIAAGGVGTFPSGVDASLTLSLAYRAVAQAQISSPSCTEDPFYLDDGRGQRFTASASRVALTLQMNAPPGLQPSGSLGVYACLGYGVAPSIAPVLKTEYIDSLTGGGPAGSSAAPIIIPPRANFLLPVRSSNPLDVMQIDVLANNGATIDSFAFANGAMITPAELAADAYSIRLTNFGLVTADYRLIFQLSV